MAPFKFQLMTKIKANQVPIVFGQEVDVVEDEALVVVLLQGLGGAHVHQHRAVERAGPVLLD